MNREIIKLALQANLINYVDHETPRVYFIDGHADIEEVEEFANLVAKRERELVLGDILQLLRSLDNENKNVHNYYGYAAKLIENKFD